MASITFSGQLDQAMNEAAAEGNKILFIPQQTVGEVLPGAASELVVESDGSYSITLAYNTYSIYHYSDVTKKKTLIANSVVVSADTAVSTIPDLIGSTVPVTEDSVLTIQGYLTDAQESAAAAATSETNAAASESYVAGVVSDGHNALTGRSESDAHPAGSISIGGGNVSDVVNLPWTEGDEVTDPNQIYVYKDSENSIMNVYAPKASETSPVTMSSQPDIDLGGDWQLDTQYDPQARLEQKMLDGEAVTIGVVGASFVWGSNGNDTGVQVDEPYPEILQGILRKWYSNENITVVNYGYPGYDTSMIIDEYMDTIVDGDCDLYLLGIDANDARTDRDISVTDFRANLEYIYNKLSFAAISFVSIAEMSNTGAVNTYGVNAYRNTMKAFAYSKNCLYMDFFDEMAELLANRGEVRGKINRDRSHWSQEGYQLVAEQIFIQGFASYPLKAKDSQFIDCISQNFRGSDLSLAVLNTQYTTARTLSVGSSAYLFVYVDEPGEHTLITHVNALITNDSSDYVGIEAENTSFTDSVSTLNLTLVNEDNLNSSFCTDYQVPTCKLIKGLNIVQYTTPSTATSATQFCGFSVVKRESRGYAVPSDNDTGADKVLTGAESQSYSELVDGFYSIGRKCSVSPNNDYVFNVSDRVVPATNGEQTKIRIRGYFVDYTSLIFGFGATGSSEALNWASDYIPLLYLNIRSLSTYCFMVNQSKVNTQIGDYYSGAGAGDRVIDIVTSDSGTSFYIDGNLCGEMDIKLPVFNLAMRTDPNGTSHSVIESVSIIGSGNNVNEDIPGERFYLHQSDEMAVVNMNGTRVTSSFT